MGSERPPAAAERIESRLLEFIQSELVGPTVTVGRDDDLLSGEMLDSIGALRLAAFVAEEFAFEIQPADFVIENFQSVAALTRYVQSATAAG